MSLPGRITRQRRRTGLEPEPIQRPNLPTRRVRCLVCHELCPKEEMIRCTSCKRWSHYQCCNLAPEELQSSELYTCDDCLNVDGRQQQPVIQQPVIQQSVVKQSIVEEPVVERPDVEQPVVQQPVIQQPVVRRSPSLLSYQEFTKRHSFQGEQITPSILNPQLGHGRQSDTRTNYQSIQETLSSSSQKLNLKPSHVYANVEAISRPLRSQNSSSSVRKTAALELQRLEDEKLLIDQRRLQKKELQQRIMNELINQQEDIEKQLEEDKKYLTNRRVQQEILENCSSSGSSSSSYISSNLFKRTMEWVNETSRQVPVCATVPETEEMIKNQYEAPHLSSRMDQMNLNQFVEPNAKQEQQNQFMKTDVTNVSRDLDKRTVNQFHSSSNVRQKIEDVPTSNVFLQTPREQTQEPLPLSTFGANLPFGTHLTVDRNSNPQPKLTREQMASRQTLPKDLPEFDGNPKKWVEFITTHETTTSLCGYTNAENLVRLRRSLTKKAYAIVESCLLMPATIPDAIDTLTETFGKPEDIVDVYITKIRNMSSIKPDNIQLFIEFSIEVRNLCATLEAAKLYDYLNNSLLLREVSEKLPAHLKINWALHRETLRAPSLSNFGTWISQMARAITKITPMFDSNLDSKQSNTNKQKNKNYVNTHTVATNSSTHTVATNSSDKSSSKNKNVSTKAPNPQSNNKSQATCDNCKSSTHQIERCHKFQALSYSEKWDVVHGNRLCRKCLGNHHVVRCTSQELCGVDGCQYKHHKLLHRPPSAMKEFQENSIVPNPRLNYHYTLLNQILYRIVPIVIYYGDRSLSTYALLDEGSSISIIDNEIAKKLNMCGVKESLCLKWTANTIRTEKDSEKISFAISGRNAGDIKYSMTARTVKHLELPRQTLSLQLLSSYNHLKRLPIETYEEVIPMILIGLDNYRLTVPRTIVEGKDDEPIATKCRLGWTICGGIHGSKELYHTVNCHICECSDDKLHDLVKEFFSMEYLGVRYSDPVLSVEEERAIQLLQNTTIRNGKQFETGLLWKYDGLALPNNFSMALRRLNCLNKQMNKDKHLRDEVLRQIEHYVNRGYARKLTKEEISATSDRTWYLPLFAVSYPKKPGKVRMVFDAAAKFNGISLNSVLLPGPDQLTSLPDVLRRFREGNIGISGDIREMFHQIVVREEDQDAQRFVFGDVNNPDHYVMQVMTFGATCSPSAAQYVKNTNATQFISQFPRAVDAIIENHYVDDLLDSVDNETEAIQLGREVRHIHQQANFEIRNWISNSTKVLRALGESDTNVDKNIELHSNLSDERVLGMWWKTSSDVFTYSLKYTKLDPDLLNVTRKPTKREVLRILMSIFDPLGLLANFLVFLKILLQDIWRSKVGWDDEIEEEQFGRWKTWLALLPSVEKIEIPRHYALGSRKSGTSVQLHIFVDASQEAYATVAYFRFDTEYGIEIALIGSKSKVAPLKLMSIPRLELQGSLLGARFSKNLREAHTLNIEKTFFWSDSSTVISWLNSDLRNYSRFVGFRVTEIHELTKVQDWRWIPTKLNVADEATKWKKQPNFESSARWFSGPEFLKQSEDQWPINSNIETTSEELRAHVLIHTMVDVPFQYNTKEFSTYRGLRRAQMQAFRYCLNLIAIVRGKDKITGPFTLSEYRRAENMLYRKAQSEQYATEISILKHNKGLPIDQYISIDSASSLYKDSPFLDDNLVLRMKGRTVLAKDIPEMTKKPVLLPRESHITFLLIDHYHSRYHHHNNETVINEMRQKFVIPRLRVMLKKVIKACQKCKNDRAVPTIPEMADLPEARLQTFVRSFSYVGLDYFGPLFVIVKRSAEKRWVMLATCMTTRAIHMEISHSMTTDSFIMAFQRLVAFRGSPLEVRSDNGTNLRGGETELRLALQEIDWEKVQREFTSADMKWIFNPPKASHMGGSWERLIRSVKKTLFEIMPARTPTDEVLETLIAEVINIVNSRPLTYVPLESDLDEALTPNHFLLGTSSGCKPWGEFSDDDLILRKNWRISQRLSNMFWERWIQEYLPTLTRRTKWFKEVKNVEVGDIVILVDDENPRNSWPKGRILSTKVDVNGRVRSAIVQTSTDKVGKNGKIQTVFNIYDRPVSKLAVLDVRPKEVSCPKDTILGGSVKDNPSPSKSNDMQLTSP